jgi:broad specificity phosphatase PhoE
MPKLYLVRHAKPAATWSEDPDPGLDPLGITQAEQTAKALQAGTAALPILTSPLRRCRETAISLERAWNRQAEIFSPVAEIPAPPLPLGERHVWLQQAMRGTWTQMQQNAPAGSPDFLGWRADLIESLRRLPEAAVIYTHFIAINVVVGAARGADDVVCFRPDHASVTVVDLDASGVHLVELGAEAETLVLTRR